MIAEKPWHINVSSKTIQISTDLKDQRSSNAFSYTEHDIWVYTLAQLLTAWISITCMWFVHQTKSVCLTHKGFLGVQILKGGLKRAVPDPSEIGWSTVCWISCWLFYKKHFLNAEVSLWKEEKRKAMRARLLVAMLAAWGSTCAEAKLFADGCILARILPPVGCDCKHAFSLWRDASVLLWIKGIARISGCKVSSTEKPNSLCAVAQSGGTAASKRVVFRCWALQPKCTLVFAFGREKV